MEAEEEKPEQVSRISVRDSECMEKSIAVV